LRIANYWPTWWPSSSTSTRAAGRATTLAVPGSLRLVPGGEVLAALTPDYRAMANMIFGDIPPLDAIMATLRQLEDEINRGAA
jgi:hypothetical protein